LKIHKSFLFCRKSGYSYQICSANLWIQQNNISTFDRY
jgi:hypothetical protein